MASSLYLFLKRFYLHEIINFIFYIAVTAIQFIIGWVQYFASFLNISARVNWHEYLYVSDWSKDMATEMPASL